MDLSQSLYASAYSEDGVSSLMTEPRERPWPRIGRAAPASFWAGFLNWSPKARPMMTATASKSLEKSAVKMGPSIMASTMDLEISDLPPPDTVQGLWQSVPSPAVPIRCQA